MKLQKNLVIILFLLLIPLAAAELQIEKTPVVDTVIPELNNQAIFNFKFTNPGNSDTFTVYSLVGVDFYPNESFSIASGATKEMQFKLQPNSYLLSKPEVLNFIYKIKSSSGIQEDVMNMKIMSIKDVIYINSYDINLDSDSALVYVKNYAGYEFPEIKARIKSDFFDFDKTFSLGKYEKKEFSVALNKEVTKTLSAGVYKVSSDIQTQGISAKTENAFKFTEKANIRTTDTTSGLIIRKRVVEKINDGNVASVVQIKVSKNIISRLFTTFNQDPISSEREGFIVYYTFQKEIKPAEVYALKVITNWLYPLILILALIAIGYLVNMYTTSDLILTKRANFVKTKGGEFALKVTVTIKAKKFVENIRVIDKLPPMVKLYPHFTIHPSKIDEANRRLEWNISGLQQYEERTLTYVIYSKIGVVGRYELPSATAIFDREGKPKEVFSNRVFFLTDVPRKEKINI